MTSQPNPAMPGLAGTAVQQPMATGANAPLPNNGTGQQLPPLPPLPNGVPSATQMPTINPTGQGVQGNGTEWSRQPSNNPNPYGGYGQPTAGVGETQTRNASQGQQSSDQEFTMSFH